MSMEDHYREGTYSTGQRGHLCYLSAGDHSEVQRLFYQKGLIGDDV